MKLNPEQIRILALMLCDYTTVDNCLAPNELDIVIKVAEAAKLPQSAIEALVRMRANAIATLET